MKFNKNKCFFASVYVAAVSAMTFTGFTSYAAEQNAQINETLSLIREKKYSGLFQRSYRMHRKPQWKRR